MNRLSWFNVTSLTFGFAFFVYADADLDHLQLQFIQAGNGLGGILDQMVWIAFSERSVPGCRLGHDQGGGDVIKPCDHFGDDGCLCVGARRALYGADVCFQV